MIFFIIIGTIIGLWVNFPSFVSTDPEVQRKLLVLTTENTQLRKVLGVKEHELDQTKKELGLIVEDYAPNWLYGPYESDKEFNTQKFFEEIGCFLATYKYKGHLASWWLDRYAKKHKRTKKYGLVTIQREQSALEVKTVDVKNDIYIYPNGEKDKLSHVMDKICGVGSNNPRYNGFARQIDLCYKRSNIIFDQAKLKGNNFLTIEEKRPRIRWGKFPTEEELKKGKCTVVWPKSQFARMLFIYVSRKHSVRGTMQIWKANRPEDFNPQLSFLK